MTAAAARIVEPMDVDAFLAFLDERPPGERWELHDGVPRMMVGGTVRHGGLTANIVRAVFDPARSRGCRAVTSVLAKLADLSAFEPDVLITCGSSDDRERHLGDARVVFEVLSPSTMRFDRGFKFSQYRSLPTLQQIVFVYQDSVRIESWLRRDESLADEPVVLTRRDDSLAVPVIGASIDVEAIYLDVTPSPFD